MASSSHLRPIIGAIRASSSRTAGSCTRSAPRALSTRCLSNGSPRCVNYTRPTRTVSTSTGMSAKPAVAKATTPATKAAAPAQGATATQSSPPSPTPLSSPIDNIPQKTQSLSNGLSDLPSDPLPDAAPATTNGTPVDWSRSFHGLSSEPFSEKASDVLMAPLNPEDVEVKPDGIVYLPEIKYRRILNRAFGPGGWGLAPRGETIVTGKSVTREYGLVVHGRLVSLARGEQSYFDPEGIPTATEGCKSNALMRCCKDLGIASELWDPVFIRKFKQTHSKEVWVEHISSKRKKKITMRKDVDVAPGGFKFS